MDPPPRRRASVQSSAQCPEVDILDIDNLSAAGSHMYLSACVCTGWQCADNCTRHL